MSKINIILNGATFSIDEDVLASASAELKSHLSSVMNGTGATINLGGTAYSVDSTKLSAAKDDFVAHLGTIAGEGSKVVIGGVEFSVDSTKLQGAMSELQTGFGELEAGDSDSVIGTWRFNEVLTPINKPFEEGFESVDCTGAINNYEMGAMTPVTYFYFYVSTESLEEFGFGNNETEGGLYYNGWENESYRTITITEQPTDPEFITWLKANATKVEIENVVGTWVFNDTISIPNKNFEASFTSNDTEYVAIEFAEPTLYYSEEVGDETEPVYYYEEGVWSDFVWATITITEEPTDPEFITWLKANAQFIGGGSGEVALAAGLYDAEGNLIKSWDELIENDIIVVHHNKTDLSVYSHYDYETDENASSVHLIGNLFLSDEITYILNNAFQRCTSLTSITIPDSVTSIASEAFYDCTSLTNISFSGTIAQWNVITKGHYWNRNVPATYVQCSNGRVTI